MDLFPKSYIAEMELPGIQMENFPPIVGNNSKTLRKLSLLEARMIGAGTESRDGSLPPNDGSRGSDNNSNSTLALLCFLYKLACVKTKETPVLVTYFSRVLVSDL